MTRPDPTALRQALHAAVGEAHVLHDGDLSAFELDWRRRYRGHAAAVVLPRDTAQVAAVVHACRAHGASLVPQGGNTGLVGASIPDDSHTQVLLSLRRMNTIRAIDVDNATLTAEAGCVLQQVQEAAREAGALFPLSLAAEGSCTIGGNLATNAGGTQVLRYGNARELCLGLEVVTAHGEVWNGLTGLRKDNTGYDLRDLFIGSEGTLGIITAATLKLFPLPAAQRTAWVALESLDDAVRLLDRCRSQLGAGLTGFEVIGAVAMQVLARHFPDLRQPVDPPARWAVLMELSDSESATHAQERLETVLGQALEDGLAQDAVIAESIEQSRRLWHLRETIPLAQAEHGPNVKHDIAVPISRIPAFVEQTDAALKQAFPGVELINFGHLGDGNLHYNVVPPEGVAALDYVEQHEAAINRLVFDAVEAVGGSISAEHGIGRIKREALAERKSPVALALMRSVKQALDPDRLMNPGRVLA